MSTAMGIAAVTAVLKSLINAKLTEVNLHDVVGGDINITSLPPDRISLNSAADPNQLNIFLYQTTYNPGWRNASLPSRDAGGDRVTNPPLALDLHYLLTSYGSQDFYPEVLLGHAMQAFHENPVLARDFIDKALTPSSTVPKEFLAAGLSSQVEQISLTPEALDPEAMSRLWSALTAHYRPTVGYRATVILIESTLARRAALPVATRTVTTVPFPNIRIDAITPPAVSPNGTIVITGSNLRATNSTIEIGGVDFTPLPANSSPSQVSLTLTTPLPAGFYAGAKGLQIVQGIFRSNLRAFVLQPAIAATAEAGAVRIDITPNIGRNQKLELLLTEYNAPSTRPARNYSFPGPATNGITDLAIPDTATVHVPVSNVIAGTYLVRVQVDGAESPLAMEAGIYAQPRITL